MIRKAKDDARRIMQKAQRESEQIISELKKAKSTQAYKEHELHGMRARLQGGIDELADKIVPVQPAEGEAPTELKVGEHVMLGNLAARATVLTAPDAKGDFMVQAGAMKMKANLKTVRRAPEEPKKKEKPKAKAQASVSVAPRQASMECDVRGMTVEEALVQVDLFLDGAQMNSLKTVTIIHGKGTGALRAGIHSHLKRHPGVAEFRLGRYGEGEDGVTIVTLK